MQENQSDRIATSAYSGRPFWGRPFGYILNMMGTPLGGAILLALLVALLAWGVDTALNPPEPLTKPPVPVSPQVEANVGAPVTGEVVGPPMGCEPQIITEVKVVEVPTEVVKWKDKEVIRWKTKVVEKPVLKEVIRKVKVEVPKIVEVEKVVEVPKIVWKQQKVLSVPACHRFYRSTIVDLKEMACGGIMPGRKRIALEYKYCSKGEK